MTPHTTLICHTTNLVCAASLLLLAAACGGLEEEELSGDTRESTAAVTSASGAAAGLAAGLAPRLQELYARHDTATAAEAREAVEDAFAAHQPCASFQWSGGLSGTVTFTNCTLAATGQTVDGALGVTIKLRPMTEVTLSFSQLTVQGNTYDGSLKVAVSGAPATVTLTADLTYLAADGETSVTLENVTVTHTKGVTVLDGKGSVTRAATTAFVARKLTWLKGDSLPSSGTLTLTQGSLTAVITFLPTTPATGVVLVQIGSLPASEMTLFHVALT